MRTQVSVESGGVMSSLKLNVRGILLFSDSEAVEVNDSAIILVKRLESVKNCELP